MNAAAARDLAAAHSPATDPGRLAALLFQSPWQEVAAAAAANLACPLPVVVFAAAVGVGGSEVRAALAARSDLSGRTAGILAGDRSPEVLDALAANPSVPGAVRAAAGLQAGV